jgi:hypothetical protein
LLARDEVFNSVVAAAGLGLLLTGAMRIRAERSANAAEIASLGPPPFVLAALHASPGHMLYIQDMGLWEVASHYEPDPAVRAHIALVYSEEEELRWDRHDTMALTAAHMQHFLLQPILSYATLRQEPGPHVFVLAHSGWDWTDQAFAEDHAKVVPLGPALGGDAAVVTFPSARR